MHTILPHPSHLSPPFDQHQFDPVPKKLFKAGKPGDAPARCPRGQSNANSMSGSLPAENPLELPVEAERSKLPEISERVATSDEAPQPSPVLAQPALSTATDLHVERAAIGSTGEYSQRTFAPTEPCSQVPQPVTSHLPSHHVETAFPPSALPATQPETTTETLAPRPARRTKAHVASACVNCKKKHLGCDPGRPCRRCVLSGKAVSMA